MNRKRKNILAIGGFDPTGGAGVTMDAAVARTFGCHALLAVTALTVQDTSRAHHVAATDSDLLRRTLTILHADSDIAAVKIGMLADVTTLSVVVDFLQQHKGAVPVVLDPVLTAGGGGDLFFGSARQAYKELLPYVDCVTPNSAELEALAGTTDTQQAIVQLRARGVQTVIHTQTDTTDGDIITHTLTDGDGRHTYTVPKQPHVFHGSGCAFATAIACGYALGYDSDTSMRSAQRLLNDAMAAAYRVGHGQLCLGI